MGTNKIPQHGDLRVCYVPWSGDHAVSFDARDLETAKAIYDALVATYTLEIEHGVRSDEVQHYIERFDENGWDYVDPAEYVVGQ